MTEDGKIDISIRALKALQPIDREFVVWDRAIPGFGVRVSPSGTKAFLLQYRLRGRERKMTLGRFGQGTTVEQARERALAAKGDIARGLDPQEAKDRQKGEIRVEAAWAEFMSANAGKWSPRTAEDYGISYRLYIAPPLGKRAVASLTFADADALHRKMRDRPVMANRTLAALSSFMRYCQKRKWYEGENPCRDVEAYEERPRERVLNDAEIARLGEALDRYDGNLFSTAAIRLILMLGCRKSEVLGLRWCEVDLDAGTARLPETKTGARTVYLPEEAVAILRGLPRLDGNPYVIPGHKRGTHMTSLKGPWRTLLAEAGLEDVRLHDLRRTFGSKAVTDGADLYTVSKLLGHSTVKMTERTYAFMGSETLKAASREIGGRIASSLAGKGAVVALRRKG